MDKPKPKTRKKTESSAATVKNWLLIAQLRSEKCELAEAKVAFETALRLAKAAGDLRSVMEALAGSLRLAGEALDEPLIRRIDAQLNELMGKHPGEIPPMAWYCKGVTAYHFQEFRTSQEYVRRYIRAVEFDPLITECKDRHLAQAKGWVLLTFLTVSRGMLRRGQFLVTQLLNRYESQNLRGINGMLYLAQGVVKEKNQLFDEAFRWFQKTHASFLGEHNWFYHLYALYGYARVLRAQQKYAESYWYLDLIDKAAHGPEFGSLKKVIAEERARLAQDAIDLLIDSRHCVIRTRDDREISLGKQYVLLQILEALYQAHSRPGEDRERGLSKAEIIQMVWHEKYRPEAHDNKLYYNINRLRKLLEPDVKNPTYLLNWKEGYRLAPGLRIQFVGGSTSADDRPTTKRELR